MTGAQLGLLLSPAVHKHPGLLTEAHPIRVDLSTISGSIRPEALYHGAWSCDGEVGTYHERQSVVGEK